MDCNIAPMLSDFCVRGMGPSAIGRTSLG